MAVLFRVVLFSILIYFIIRMVREFIFSPKEDDKKVKSTAKERKVSKDVGEYVDFEEIEKDKRQKEEGKSRDYR